MTDIRADQIKAWLASIPDDAADIASRAYMNARRSHSTGDRPKWMRAQWSHLPTEYRQFLTAFVKAGIDNEKHLGDV